MEKLAVQIGKLGSSLGALVGVIELSIGTRILSWIGNKENPFVLGLVTVILSMVALFSIVSAGNGASLKNDRKLAIFLGVFLPAAICFTTVGRLWYLPGSLLLLTSFLLVNMFWLHKSTDKPSRYFSKRLHISQIIGIGGSILTLISIGLGFFITTFGLYQSELTINANPVRIHVIPMDIVRLDHLSTFENGIKLVEVSFVMIVYIFLILGAAIALISSLADSRMFSIIGGVGVLFGLVLFSLGMPGIFNKIGISSMSLVDFYSSLGLGWFLALVGAFLIMMAGVFQFDLRKKMRP